MSGVTSNFMSIIFLKVWSCFFDHVLIISDVLSDQFNHLNLTGCTLASLNMDFPSTSPEMGTPLIAYVQYLKNIEIIGVPTCS